MAIICRQVQKADTGLIYLPFKHGAQGRKRLKAERADAIYGNFRHTAVSRVYAGRGKVILCVLSERVTSGSVADLTKDDARDFITERFGAETLAGLSNSVWKSRLEALATIQEGLGALELKADGAKVCLALCHIPGWKDSNFQVRGRSTSVPKTHCCVPLSALSPTSPCPMWPRVEWHAACIYSILWFGV